ncbi:MAG: gamma carbonic anhydrase family protein [Roseimicrobium sp.]
MATTHRTVNLNPQEGLTISNLERFLIPAESPIVHHSAFVAAGAVLVGGVTVGADASVWYGCVLRGDINRIFVGAESNVQDGTIVHVADAYPAIIGERVSVGHRAVIHACEIGDETLVGMGAIVMDGARVGRRCVIAAGSLVTKNTVIPEGSLVMGSPAKIVRALSAEEQEGNTRLALKYVEIARRYRAAGFGPAT